MSGLMPPGPLSYQGAVSIPYIPRTFDPTTSDFNFTVPTLWVNTLAPRAFILTAKPQNVARWDLIGSGSGDVSSLTGNDSEIVGPDSDGNINVVGDGSVITTSGDPTTNTETIAITGIVPVDHGGTGASSFSANQLIVGNGTDPLSSTLSPTVNSITIIDAPISPTDGTNKEYVDAIAAGFTFIDAVLAASTANLTVTYNNGTAGVGATLTNAGTQVVFTTDGITPIVTDRILIKDQTDQTQNGIYTVTNVGSISANWVLTRATDYDTVPPIAQANLVPVQQGTAFARTLWIQTAPVTTIGTDPIVFQQFNPPGVLQVVNGGTGNSSFSSHQIILGGTTSTDPLTQVSSTGNVGEILTSQGAGSSPTFAPTLGSQTAFSVFLSTNALNQTGNAAAVTVLFDTVYFDGASAYNPSTGIYTIPSTGIYLFGFNGTYINASVAPIFETSIFQNVIQSAKFVNYGVPPTVTLSQGVSGVSPISATAGDQIYISMFANGQGANTVGFAGGNGKETEFWGYRIA